MVNRPLVIRYNGLDSEVRLGAVRSTHILTDQRRSLQKELYRPRARLFDPQSGLQFGAISLADDTMQATQRLDEIQTAG